MVERYTCPICVEDVRQEKVISCPACNMEVCQTCFVQRIKTSYENDGSFKCMNPICDHKCDRTFVCRILPASIVFSTLKKHHEEVLFQKEKFMLPLAMSIIPFIDKENELKKQKKDIHTQINILKTNLDTNDKIKVLKARIKEIDIIVSDCINRREELINPRHLTESPTNTPIEILCPCPSDDCRGYIKKVDKKCGMCNTEICGKCYIITSDDHICNLDDVESVKLINKECKTCPNCGVISRKTEGCAQVWCYACHKAWDWRTRLIDNGPIFAKDYLIYMRKRMPVQNECNQLFNPTHHLPHLQNLYPATCTDQVIDEVLQYFEIACEYGYNYGMIAAPNNMDLRISFLKKEIDENEWKQLLYKRDKAHILKSELNNMYCAYKETMKDAIKKVCESKSETELKENIEIMRDFNKMMVTEYIQLTKAFNSKQTCPFII